MIEQKFFYKLQMTEALLLITGVILLLSVYQFELDFKLADVIYEQFQWRFKKSFLVEGIMHKYARYLIILAFLIMLFKLASMIIEASNPSAAYDLFILLLSISTSVFVVTILKRLIEVDCPWDLIQYGGDKPYFPLFEYNDKYLPSAHCFPASHASVGFSWIALYFYFKVKQNRIKFKVLAWVLLMGIAFGIAQQLRGAHFISHDLWSFLICLINCMLIYKLAYRQTEELET